MSFYYLVPFLAYSMAISFVGAILFFIIKDKLIAYIINTIKEAIDRKKKSGRNPCELIRP